MTQSNEYFQSTIPRSEIIGQQIGICKLEKMGRDGTNAHLPFKHKEWDFFVFKLSYQSYFRVEEFKVVIIASPNTVPLVFLDHLVPLAQKVLEDFLVCQEEMVFLG